MSQNANYQWLPSTSIIGQNPQNAIQPAALLFLMIQGALKHSVINFQINRKKEKKIDSPTETDSKQPTPVDPVQLSAEDQPEVSKQVKQSKKNEENDSSQEEEKEHLLVNSAKKSSQQKSVPKNESIYLRAKRRINETLEQPITNKIVEQNKLPLEKFDLSFHTSFLREQTALPKCHSLDLQQIEEKKLRLLRQSVSNWNKQPSRGRRAKQQN